ncbi:hypothetical protein [Paraburkholderia bannensis]|uniref:hypothetical protein n=1 Tax=Paraburkholderia bannensis TaxID=765414 RepID=UPI0012EC97ED|nr:hypothetical protein [Paraburkholderia bannensis]
MIDSEIKTISCACYESWQSARANAFSPSAADNANKIVNLLNQVASLNRHSHVASGYFDSGASTDDFLLGTALHLRAPTVQQFTAGCLS